MKTKRILSVLLAVLMITATFAAGMTVSASSSTYSDVTEDMWAYDDIMYVTENGLMNGTGGSSFSPAVSLTRSMVVTVLYRMEGSPRTNFTELFLDVADRQFYSEAVIWAKQNGIVTATSFTEWGEEYFSPDRDITRQELATMFVRFAKYKNIDTANTASLDKFTDKASVADWASDAMKWATNVGLINGTGNGTTLSPTGKATREQFAAIIHRYCEAEFKYVHAFAEPQTLSNYTEQPYSLVSDADVYVAVDGNDQNPGTIDKPLATFAAAKAKVQELKKTAKDGIVVAFKAGNYGTLDNLTFDAADGGTKDLPITYCKYGDGDVIFQNGVTILESEFKLIDDSDDLPFPSDARPYIYKADLSGKVDSFTFKTRLFTSTGVATEARLPDWNYYSNVTTTVDPRASILLQGYLPSKVGAFSTYEGLKVNGFLRTGWLVDCFPVKSYDKATGILTFDFEKATFDNGYTLDSYVLMEEGRTDDLIFFSNLPDFLDNTGEFWFDNSTSTLYVYRAKGNYYVDKGIGSFMTLNAGAEYITFKGLDFNTTSGSAVVLDGDHTTFDLCTFGNIGGNAAIYAKHEVMGLHVYNSEFYNFVDAGIKLDGVISYALENTDNRIVNNYFHDFTLPQYFSSAVEVVNDVGTYIAHNYFYEGGHGAIRWDGSIDTIIEYNVFDKMMTKTQDFGAVYTYHSTTNRGNEVRYNIFKNIPVYAIYLDNDTCGQEIYGNIFYNNGTSIVQNGGRENKIHDNVFIKEGGITSNPGFYSYIADGNPEEIVNDQYYHRYVNDKPAVGSQYYELWYSRWPELYSINIDPEKLGDKDCLFTTFTYLHNNAGFGVKVNNAEMIRQFGEDIGNKNYSMDENPYFVNPAAGDYSIKDGADFFDIPYEKIGRY